MKYWLLWSYNRRITLWKAWVNTGWIRGRQPEPRCDGRSLCNQIIGKANKTPQRQHHFHARLDKIRPRLLSATVCVCVLKRSDVELISDIIKLGVYSGSIARSAIETCVYKHHLWCAIALHLDPDSITNLSPRQIRLEVLCCWDKGTKIQVLDDHPIYHFDLCLALHGDLW